MPPSSVNSTPGPLRAASVWIGRTILSGLLILVYFCVITPVGLAMRARRRTASFRAWNDRSTGFQPVSWKD